MEIRINEAELRGFANGVLQKCGLAPKDGFTVADSLIFANLRGADSHGIARLPFYVRRLTDGGTKARPKIEIIRETEGTATLNGDDGMGQIVSLCAVETAIRKARSTGVSFVAANRSSHNGAISYYSIKIAEAGMIGISMSNTTPVMAAWEGSGATIGNNPLSIAAPTGHGQPLVLDMAMSRVAGGKVRLAATNRQRIPLGWIVDERGRPTDDPQELTKGGALMPFGEHKGFALAVMLEVLSGVVAQSGMLGQIPFWVKETVSPLNIGHSFIAINIASLMDLSTFYDRMGWMIKNLKRSQMAECSPDILMPGELEWRTERERRANGIPISPEVYRDLEGLSSSYNVPLQS